MIVPIKTVTLLTLANEESAALDILRDLGVMQILPAAKVSAAAQSSIDSASAAQRISSKLAGFAADRQIVSDIDGDIARGREILALAETSFRRLDEISSRIDLLKQKLERLAVWGDFKKENIDELRRNGVFVYLCTGSVNDYKQIAELPGVTLCVISQIKGIVAFAAVFSNEPEKAVLEKLPLFKLNTDDDPLTLKNELTDLQQEAEKINSGLETAAAGLPAAEKLCAELKEAVEFDRARDAMSEHGAVSVLQGYVPEPEIENLRETAKIQGWGLLIRDPEEEENVPVLLKDNRFTRIIKPLFDFLGIVPGYREIDISGGILIFFAIFYAMIIGDAGYGICFSILAISGCFAAKKRPALKLPAGLFLLLSIMTTIWGALCGSWFGLEHIPGTDTAFPALEALKNFSSETAKQANVQFICFVLAVAQLTTGHVWKALHEKNWRSIGENFGWILILWGNFFLTMRLIVYPGTFPDFMYILYGTGLLFVLIFGVKWNQAADIFQFPFNIIGSFTDILSYIRLFAVGLSGACIASSFNGMAFDVCKASVWLLPFGILIVLVGHGLNIILAFLGVLVHAVRLNTLEFSNHTGLSWSGQAFHPFKKSTKK